MIYAMSLTGGQKARLQEISVESGSRTQIITPDADCDGFSKVTVYPEKHSFNLKSDSVAASSNYILKLANVSAPLSSIEQIWYVYINLLNTSALTPVTRAVGALMLSPYTASVQKYDCYISTKSGTTGYSQYYEELDDSNTPLAITIEKNSDGQTNILFELTESALVPGKTSRLVFDTSIPYQVVVVFE